MSTVKTGTVRWFNSQKGFGFIEQSSGPDVFVHFNSIITPGGYKPLEQNQRVEFKVTRGPKGTQAVNVKVIS